MLIVQVFLLRRFRHICVLFTVLLLTAPPAFSDLGNRNAMPIGDRSAFMANTGVADGSSSMAVLLNPGTLGFVDNSKISLSGNLYFNFDVKYSPFLRFNNDSADINVNGFNSVPNSAVSIYKWGENTLAFSVLVPDFQEISTLQKVRMTNYDGVVQYNGKTQDLWVGATFSRKWREKYGIGLSLFGTRYSTQSAADISASVVLGNLPVAINIMENRQGAAISLESVIGIFFRPTERLATGLKFAPPGIRVSGSGSFYSVNRNVVNGVVSTTIDDRQNLDFYHYRPADGSLGGEFRFSDELRWYLDASLQFPLQFQAMPAASDPKNVQLQYTPRLSTGLDIHVYKFFSVMTGLAWIPSATAPLEPKFRGNSRAANYLTTLGIIYSDRHVRTGLGAFVLYADGVQQIDEKEGNIGAIRAIGTGALLSSSYEF
ncbi:MAG: hypothetical protein JNJ69_05615 [Leptospiraceae bacterium]|nr:hypothetical protein [Leptospiraceae bacterium]